MYENPDMVKKAFDESFLSEYLRQAQLAEMIELKKIIKELSDKKGGPISVLDIELCLKSSPCLKSQLINSYFFLINLFFFFDKTLSFFSILPISLKNWETPNEQMINRPISAKSIPLLDRLTKIPIDKTINPPTIVRKEVLCKIRSSFKSKISTSISSICSFTFNNNLFLSAILFIPLTSPTSKSFFVHLILSLLNIRGI